MTETTDEEERLYDAIRELERGVREHEGATWEAWQWSVIGERVNALKESLDLSMAVEG